MSSPLNASLSSGERMKCQTTIPAAATTVSASSAKRTVSLRPRLPRGKTSTATSQSGAMSTSGAWLKRSHIVVRPMISKYVHPASLTACRSSAIQTNHHALRVRRFVVRRRA